MSIFWFGINAVSRLMGLVRRFHRRLPAPSRPYVELAESATGNHGTVLEHHRVIGFCGVLIEKGLEFCALGLREKRLAIAVEHRETPGPVCR